MVTSHMPQRLARHRISIACVFRSISTQAVPAFWNAGKASWLKVVVSHLAGSSTITSLLGWRFTGATNFTWLRVCIALQRQVALNPRAKKWTNDRHVIITWSSSFQFGLISFSYNFFKQTLEEIVFLPRNRKAFSLRRQVVHCTSSSSLPGSLVISPYVQLNTV